MGLLSKMNEKALQDWANNLTPEQIEEYERQGMDMSEYKVIVEERMAEERRMAEAVDLSMLDRIKTTRTPEFVDEVARFNKMSDKNKPKLETATLVYGKVVQASGGMFKSDPKGTGALVILYALDEAHRYDREWLTKTAERIYELKKEFQNKPKTGVQKFAGMLGMGDNILYNLTIGNAQDKKKSEYLPEDIRGLIRCIALDGGSFHIKVGASLAGGAEAWCGTLEFIEDQKKLPFAKIPDNRFIPLLIAGDDSDDVQLIPPRYYTK